jgi:hypothetical protein
MEQGYLPGDNEPTQNAENKTNQSSNETGPSLNPALGESKPYPSECHYKVSCKTEKNWWDKLKPWVEIAGIGLLALYTGFTIATFWQIRKQTPKIAESADAAARAADATMLQLKGTQAAVVAPFKITIDTEGVKIQTGNAGHVIAENVTAGLTVTRRTWPAKKLLGSVIRFTLQPQRIDIPGSIPGNDLTKKFPITEFTRADWEAIQRGEQFLTVELVGSYEDGFRDKITWPAQCQSFIFLSQLIWNNGHNQGWGSPMPYDCGRTFDIEMTATMKQRKEVEAGIQKERKK